MQTHLLHLPGGGRSMHVGQPKKKKWCDCWPETLTGRANDEEICEMFVWRLQQVKRGISMRPHIIINYSIESNEIDIKISDV